jgi:hypothetical protein
MKLVEAKTRKRIVDANTLFKDYKLRLGNQLKNGQKTTSELHAKYDLPMNLLQKYNRKVMKGKYFNENNGRPSILSAETENKLKLFSEEEKFH